MTRFLRIAAAVVAAATAVLTAVSGCSSTPVVPCTHHEGDMLITGDFGSPEDVTNGCSTAVTEVNAEFLAVVQTGTSEEADACNFSVTVACTDGSSYVCFDLLPAAVVDVIPPDDKEHDSVAADMNAAIADVYTGGGSCKMDPLQHPVAPDAGQ